MSLSDKFDKETKRRREEEKRRYEEANEEARRKKVKEEEDRRHQEVKAKQREKEVKENIKRSLHDSGLMRQINDLARKNGFAVETHEQDGYYFNGGIAFYETLAIVIGKKGVTTKATKYHSVPYEHGTMVESREVEWGQFHAIIGIWIYILGDGSITVKSYSKKQSFTPAEARTNLSKILNTIAGELADDIKRNRVAITLGRKKKWFFK